jgi:hypothetical protein
VKKIAATWIALVCGVLDTVQAAPELKMDLPDWGKTPVRDRDLGHGVHMLESFGGNIGVLAGEQGVLLVDAEWPQLNAQVRYVVNTYWHWDHVGGIPDCASASRTIATAGCVIWRSSCSPCRRAD